MAYTVQTALNDLSTVIHGTTGNKIPNISGILNRAARAVLLDVDPKETLRLGTIAGVIDTTYDYTLPADLKGDRVLDVRPASGRTPSDEFEQIYGENFDAYKGVTSENAFTIQWQNGVKTIRITAPTVTTATDYQIVYYSKYLFRSASTNAFQETIDITNGTDTALVINLDTESYNLLFNKAAYYTAQSLQGSDAEYDAQYWSTEYTNALTRYRAMYPSEAMIKGESYYPMPRRRSNYPRQWPH